MMMGELFKAIMDMNSSLNTGANNTESTTPRIQAVEEQHPFELSLNVQQHLEQ